MVIICCSCSHVFFGIFGLLISTCRSLNLKLPWCVQYREALSCLKKIDFDILVCVFLHDVFLRIYVCCPSPGCWQRDMCLPSAWAPGPFPGLPDEVWRLSKRSPQVEERPQRYGLQPTFHIFPSFQAFPQLFKLYIYKALVNWLVP